MNSLQWLRLALMLALATVATSVAAQSASTAVSGLTPAVAMTQAQAAFFAEDRSALEALSGRTQAWSGSASTLETYAYAYVHFRSLQLAVWSGNDRAAKQAGGRCTDSLERLLKTESRFAEGHALLSGCYGYLANLGGLAAIRNGSRSGKAMEAALAITASHPRVILLDGFGVYFRPAFVGGDKAAGCRRFAEAVAAFAVGAGERAAALAGHDWGFAEALYFVGRCARDSGDPAGAAEAFARSLEQAPNFRRARAGG